MLQYKFFLFNGYNTMQAIEQELNDFVAKHFIHEVEFIPVHNTSGFNVVVCHGDLKE